MHMQGVGNDLAVPLMDSITLEHMSDDPVRELRYVQQSMTDLKRAIRARVCGAKQCVKRAALKPYKYFRVSVGPR